MWAARFWPLLDRLCSSLHRSEAWLVHAGSFHALPFTLHAKAACECSCAVQGHAHRQPDHCAWRQRQGRLVHEGGAASCLLSCFHDIERSQCSLHTMQPSYEHQSTSSAMSTTYQTQHTSAAPHSAACKRQQTCCLQVYTLSVPDYKWAERTSSVQGEPPTPRGGHTAVALGDERHLLVFGGGNFNAGAYYSGIALLDTHTWRWITPCVEVRCTVCLSCQLAGFPEAEQLRLCSECLAER